MAANFHQLMVDEHEARAALEAAVEAFFRAETTLIEQNHARDAALELVHLLVEKKIKHLAALARTDAASANPPISNAP